MPDDDDLLMAAGSRGLAGAIEYWDAKFDNRTGLHAALIALVDAGRLDADVYGSGERREITRIRGLSLPEAGPPGGPPRLEISPVESPAEDQDRRAVFVVHGRDDQLRKSMFDFLRSIDLRPMEWVELTRTADSASPYVGDLLDMGFERAQAVVVLFSPDEEAKLVPHLVTTDDESGRQARPNVIFEAGLAMGRRPARTVLVEVGRLRPMSDIAGRHLVRLDDNSDRRVALRQDLAQRLEAAGCPVSLRGTDWHTAGTFVTPVS